MTHYGFAQVPRIVIRGEEYRTMTLIELGLYTGLKDICGDDGECFYTLRNLAEVLHTSISTLSRYIPRLRDTWKVIHATKKTRGSAGNKHEVYHIRIVNIWTENDALYKPASQDCFREKQSQAPSQVAIGNSVSERNKVDETPEVVSNRNNTVSERNEDCFYLNDRRRTINKDNLTEEERDTSVTARADDTILSIIFDANKLIDFGLVAQMPVVRQWLQHDTLPTPAGRTIHAPTNSTATHEPQSPNLRVSSAPDRLSPELPTTLSTSSESASQREIDMVAPKSGGDDETQNKQNSYSRKETIQSAATQKTDKPVRTRTTPKTEKPAKEPAVLSEEEQAREAEYNARRAKWQKYINDRRGGPLPRKGPCINETKDINDLIRRRSDEDIALIDEYTVKQDWRYKNHPEKIGASAWVDNEGPALEWMRKYGRVSTPRNQEQRSADTKPALMTHDQAWQLLREACQQVEKLGCQMVKTEAVESQKTPGAWLVKVMYDDMQLPTVKFPEQWGEVFREIEQLHEGDKQYAAKLARRGA